MAGLRRMAGRVGLYSAARTLARPPITMRRPRRVPLSRLTGAMPARLAMRRRSRVPSSGLIAPRSTGDQRAGGGLADAGHGGEQVLARAPGRRGAHGVVEVGSAPAAHLHQPSEMQVDPDTG